MYTKDRKIAILIVDDHPVVQQGLETILAGLENVSVVHSTVNGQDSLRLLEKEMIDLVLLDINLPDMSGIDLCREIKQAQPGIKVLAISNCTERYIITKILQNGASG